MRSLPNPFRSIGPIAIPAIAFAGLLWAGNNVGPAETDLTSVQQNGCSVTTGNGKVNDRPSANCPVDIELGNVLTTTAGAANDMAPGDVESRPLNITNDGNNALDPIFMKAVPAASQLNGSLRLTVERCSVGWSPTLTGSYSCSGTKSSVLTGGALPQNGLNLGASPAKARNGVDRLLVSVQLVDSAGNTLQGLGTTMTYTLTATKN